MQNAVAALIQDKGKLQNNAWGQTENLAAEEDTLFRKSYAAPGANSRSGTTFRNHPYIH